MTHLHGAAFDEIHLPRHLTIPDHYVILQVHLQAWAAELIQGAASAAGLMPSQRLRGGMQQQLC